MLRLVSTIGYTLLILTLLTGCSGNGKVKPPTTNIKLGDLAPDTPITPVSSIQTASFDFYSLEMPSENIDRLSDIWPMLYTRTIHPADSAAFTVNSFRLVFGEQQMWQKTAELLESAGAISGRKTALHLDYGQIDDFVIKRINKKTNVFYLKSDMEIQPLQTGRGQIVLRIKIAPMAGERGICQLIATPVFMPIRSAIPVNNSTPMEDIILEPFGFIAYMSPGDFLLMGPAFYPTNENSLAALFFTDPKRTKIRIYAIFCSGITD